MMQLISLSCDSHRLLDSLAHAIHQWCMLLIYDDIVLKEVDPIAGALQCPIRYSGRYLM